MTPATLSGRRWCHVELFSLGVILFSEQVMAGLRMKDALCRSMWSVVVNQIAAGLR